MLNNVTKALITFILLGIIFSPTFSCRKSSEIGKLYIYITTNTSSNIYHSIYLPVSEAQIDISCDQQGNTEQIYLDTTFELISMKNKEILLQILEHSNQNCLINEVRLLIPYDGKVVLTNNDTFPLHVPSGAQTGLKGTLNYPLEAQNILTIIINLDSNLVKTRNFYILKPTIEVSFI